MGSTLNDVARAAGVSIKTVSNVINAYPHVRPETRGRVEQAIAALDYRPNLAARGLRSGRTGVIGLVVPALRENYFAELADAVIRRAKERGLSVMVEQTGGERDAELQAVSGGQRRFLDGLLFSPMAMTQADADALLGGPPVVLLGERIFDGPTDHVTMQNTGAARAAVEHLIAGGRRRIALVGADLDREDEAGSASLRLHGYREALDGAGASFDPALVRPAARWDRAGGAESARLLLQEGIPFDAIFALSDTLALGALRTLGAAGLQVPEDVHVIGFDDIDEGRYAVPSLSTVDVGREEIAAIAVDLLVERIAEKDVRHAPRTVAPDYRVVARESSGTAAVKT